MARRRRAPVRSITPDPLFESELIARFILCLMKSGKKSVAQRIVYGALNKVQSTLLEKQGAAAGESQSKSKSQEDKGKAAAKKSSAKDMKALSGSETIMTNPDLRRFALEKFEEILEKIGPVVEVRSRRVGGATYQVPVEVRPKRRLALAMRWLIKNAAARNEKNMMQRLAHEILEALEGRGGAMKQRENTHRMAKANQAFAHYSW